MTKEQVNVTDESSAAIWILEAMVSHVGDDGDILEVFKPTGTLVEVELRVNGIKVDAVKALSEAWRRLEAEFEKHARDKAVEMLTGAGLKQLFEEIEFAEWKIRDRLEAACLTK